MMRVNPVSKRSLNRQSGVVMRLLLVLTACFGLALSTSYAQTGGQGAIQGTVMDATGAADTVVVRLQ